nr:cyanophycin synthetase [Kineosporia sp. NBRC 101677]
MLKGLAGYDGVRRRFELKGSAAGVQVYDDYAHHPSKVSAQLRAARQVVSDEGAGGRLIVAFQPHLYSRTRDFAADFGAALSLADEVVILAVYGAREAPMPGVSSQLIVDEISLPSEHVHYIPARAEVAHRIAGLARSGDVVITMGAGDITALGHDILEALQRRQKDVDNSTSRHP